MGGEAVGCLIGVFDMLHVGHVRLIRRARMKCDKLVVIVVRDEAVSNQKGPTRPIIPDDQRIEMVCALAGVHMVVASDSFNPGPAIEEYERRVNNRVSYFFLGEDQDHIPLEGVKAAGIEIIPLERTPGISTSQIAGKLKC